MPIKQQKNNGRNAERKVLPPAEVAVRSAEYLLENNDFYAKNAQTLQKEAVQFLFSGWEKWKKKSPSV